MKSKRRDRAGEWPELLQLVTICGIPDVNCAIRCKCRKLATIRAKDDLRGSYVGGGKSGNRFTAGGVPEMDRPCGGGGNNPVVAWPVDDQSNRGLVVQGKGRDDWWLPSPDDGVVFWSCGDKLKAVAGIGRIYQVEWLRKIFLPSFSQRGVPDAYVAISAGSGNEAICVVNIRAQYGRRVEKRGSQKLTIFRGNNRSFTRIGGDDEAVSLAVKSSIADRLRWRPAKREPTGGSPADQQVAVPASGKCDRTPR